MNIQEREERDYEMGCMTEQQNAFARSRAEIQLRNDSARIAAAVEAGQHVVCTSRPVTCPSTDAFIGSDICLEFAGTKEEAEVKYNELHMAYEGTWEADLWMEPRKRVVLIETPTCDDVEVPF
jgi:hypothetical protein